MARNGYKKMIDEGGELDAAIKQASKRLKEIKADLKKRAEGMGTHELEGHLYKIIFSDSSERIPDSEKVIEVLLRIEPFSEVDPEETVELKYGDLMKLAAVASFKINDLKKVLGESVIDSVSTTVEKPYYRSSFKRIYK